MNSLKINRLSALFIFILLIIICFLILAGINNSSNEDFIIETRPVIYIYLILVILFALCQFLIILNLIRIISLNISEVQTGSGKNLIENKKQSDININESTNDSVNVEEFLKKILLPVTKETNINKYADNLLINISKEIEIVTGLIYIKEPKTKLYKVYGKYAYSSEEEPGTFKTGEGISGQVAKDKTILNIRDIPEDYIVCSGLGKGNPKHLLIVPIINVNHSIGIIELASFKPFNKNTELVFEKLNKEIGGKISSLINK